MERCIQFYETFTIAVTSALRESSLTKAKVSISFDCFGCPTFYILLNYLLLGALTIKSISIDPSADEQLLADKYLALSSVAAIVKYVEFIQHISIPPQSMKINLKSSQGTMLIDSLTAKALELIVTNDGSSAKSLLGILDHTKTAAGARFLCSNILQPPSDINAIVMRHQCVAEFLSKEKLYAVISLSFCF
jgi:DNA mismatch repair ATPase MutS